MALPSMTVAVMTSSMAKVTPAGDDHGHAVLLGRGDDLLVPDGAAGLDHRGNAGLRSAVDAVPEREERVRRHGRPACSLPRVASGDLHRGHPVHLPGPHPDR